MVYSKSQTKKWSLFDIVRKYSIGTNLTLKVGLVLMETTGYAIFKTFVLVFWGVVNLKYIPTNKYHLQIIALTYSPNKTFIFQIIVLIIYVTESSGEWVNLRHAKICPSFWWISDSAPIIASPQM